MNKEKKRSRMMLLVMQDALCLLSTKFAMSLFCLFNLIAIITPFIE